MANECTETSELLKWGLSIGIPALAGLTGVYLGVFLTGRQEKRQRKYSFIERQLNEFYSPLLGLRAEIQMKDDLRDKIKDKASLAWDNLCAKARESGPDELQKLTDERFPEFERIIEYDNRMLMEELIPAYRLMAKIFRENILFAEPGTRSYLKELIEFLDVWDRWTGKSLPSEVLSELKHDEKKLEPFYKHLEETHNRLRSKLATGDI